MKSIRSILALAALSVCFSACGNGGDDDDFFIDSEVVNMAVEESEIEVGEGTVLGVLFSFDPERVFDEGKNVRVVVRLPEGIEYRDDTAEIDGIDGDDKIGAQVFPCQVTGETYLLFDMDEFDLDEAFNPPGDGGAVITLTIDGTFPVDFEAIEAAAGDETPFFECGERFLADEQVGISVVR